jgi:hypothetical protein
MATAADDDSIEIEQERLLSENARPRDDVESYAPGILRPDDAASNRAAQSQQNGK